MSCSAAQDTLILFEYLHLLLHMVLLHYCTLKTCSCLLYVPLHITSVEKLAGRETAARSPDKGSTPRLYLAFESGQGGQAHTRISVHIVWQRPRRQELRSIANNGRWAATQLALAYEIWGNRVWGP
jgi:hypothetical protein